MNDTIAAVATSSNNGSISIIRVSGKDALRYVSSIFYLKSGKADLTVSLTHTIHYGFIYDGKNRIDEVLVLVMRAPKSYTAEDVVEIHCHGGYFVCRKILQLLIKTGVHMAEPGEFTKRAFLNGRIDLSQAESVMDIIQSRNDLALQNSISHLRGRVRDKVRDLRNLILEDTAYLEAALDDPEHISLDGFSERIKQHAENLKKEMDHLLENCENGRKIREGIQAVILGKPNVGKSSFLNCLLREDRAIVTDVPGTTRDTLEEDMMINGIHFRLIDTAGIHESDDKVEYIGIEKALQSLKKADFVFCILDASRKLTEEDFYILQQAENVPGMVLLNKSDLDVSVLEDSIGFCENKKIMPFSAKTGQGLEEFEEYLSEQFLQMEPMDGEEIYITNIRQQEALREAAASVDQLLLSIENQMPEDFYSIDLCNAYESLGKIVGETVGEDIINKIFKDFCMGK